MCGRYTLSLSKRSELKAADLQVVDRFNIAPQSDVVVYNNDRQIQQIRFHADPAGVVHVEFGDPERWSHLVLGDLGPDPVTDDGLALLDGLDAPNVDAGAGVELQGTAAGCGFGAAEHHADLLSQLVDEDGSGV